MNITSAAALGDPEPSEYEGVEEGKGQRVLNGLVRARLSCGRLNSAPRPPLPPPHHVSRRVVT
jgi:hypothetical protein